VAVPPDLVLSPESSTLTSVVESSQRQTRRRGAALEQAILDAAWVEIAERGWSGFTIDAVAARAGTAKAVIYRRWGSRNELAKEMLRRTTGGGRGTFVPSGDLRADLLTFLRAMSEFLVGPFGHVVRGIICDTDEPGLMSVFGDVVVADVGAIIDEALRAGDLVQVPSPLAVNVGHALVMSEFLHTGSVPTHAGLERLVDAVWLPALRSPA
jgi:AcrR family transcriptional regulator